MVALYLTRLLALGVFPIDFLPLGEGREDFLVYETGMGIPEGLIGDERGRGIRDLTVCVGDEAGETLVDDSLPLNISHFLCNFLNLLPFSGFSSEIFESRDSGPSSWAIGRVSFDPVFFLSSAPADALGSGFSKLSVYSSSSSPAKRS